MKRPYLHVVMEIFMALAPYISGPAAAVNLVSRRWGWFAVFLVLSLANIVVSATLNIRRSQAVWLLRAARPLLTKSAEVARDATWANVRLYAALLALTEPGPRTQRARRNH